MVRYFSATLAIASVLSLGACAKAPEVNAAAIGNLYTADGVSQHNHDKTATGRDAIVEDQKALFSQFAVQAEIMPDETKTVGTLGFDRGRYRMTMTPKAGGEAMVDEGRYVVLLQKDADGAWKVSSDIDNSITPLPPPPAAPSAAAGNSK